MLMRTVKLALPLSLVLTAAAATAMLGCEPRENPYEVKAKSGPDLHKIDNTASEEELAEARKAAGHPSQDEIAKENAAMFEKGAREYIKTRMSEYRDFMKEFRGHLDDIEKQAPKWKDDAAFEKFDKKYREKVKDFGDTYDTLTAKGVEGGNTQADLGAAFRDFEQLNSDIGPGVTDNEAFPEALKSIRERLDEVDAALDDIEQDETLEINADYKPKKKKKKK
ncbi:hypothetical protein G6O69_10910 [Pseudenhygromyxa sp. WMMC2535]|uniref:hypothetical protein n=1 Tax=Pseudenhygromyxa sp. WMMC2535 TaxID=2712867 RepID=UPI0015547A47|nr:hypothetical protein [Pseudenhygromyxa sp. WMMC2535]NVB38340.1 hypothetical protein [Pseudenhygromyxa sp. WMMC2535]